ncbi:MAG TPA: PQQ-dependent sugar dehydrogenase [Candidatus Polarisedimenticolia bacterium]|nr:PQQ-dependent sugar dehydrogenase [Candidatus Polarisedimenticolia bacterium]
MSRNHLNTLASFLRRLGTGIALALLATGSVRALPTNFNEVAIYNDLVFPVAVRFSPDGRVFIAEKSGILKVFPSIFDNSPTVVINLGPEVHDFWDRGLLGMALDPQFPTNPYIYLLYTYDFDPFEPSIPAPRWGDTCPDKNGSGVPIGPGATRDGCVVNARVVRIQVNPDNTLAGPKQVLLENQWCQQFPSHSIGSLAFGPEGALYISAGDGGNFDTEDWGQLGGTQGTPPYNYPFTPANPCADPNTARGTPTTKPTAEGGALRAQDIRTGADTLTYNGTILRINPATGAAWPDNPLVGGANTVDDRIIAYGLRNPFRTTMRPGTSELWIGDVGYNTWDEIDRITSPTDATVENFGWPCVEGPDRPAGYNSGLNLCTSLPTASTVAPYYSIRHGQTLYTGDPCSPTAGTSISGLAFYTGGTYPTTYNNALFFADHTRDCIFVMTAGAGGLPDTATRVAFVTAASNARQLGNPQPVDLQIGPGGDLYSLNYEGGQLRRVVYNAGNSPPTAVIQANPTSGPIPLQVNFSGLGSNDPNPGTTLLYAWDLDGDGQYDDSTLPQPVWVYNQIGNVTARLRVTDDDGASATTTQLISPGNAPPVATITAPLASLTWHTGEVIAFSGSGFDSTDGNLAAAAMRWDVILHHCVNGPGTCHDHTIQTFNGVALGNFTAPDHPYYTELEFRLTVTDSGSLTDVESVTLLPEVVTNTFSSVPSGMTLSVSTVDGVTQFTRPAIVGSTVSLVAISPQLLGGTNHYFTSWNDGGTAGKSFTAALTPLSFTANYAVCVAAETTCDGLDNDCDGAVDDVAPPPTPSPLSIDAAAVSWSAIAGASAYDVVRGHLTSPGVNPFSAAGTDACIAPATASTSVAFSANPPLGTAWWFVTRSRNCGGPGTYDSGGPGQSGSRDAGIAASGAGCP